VVLKEGQRDNGKHLGWFKNKKHHTQRTYVVKRVGHKQPKAKRSVKVNENDQKKNRWDARK
jgi:hypothetical protein